MTPALPAILACLVVVGGPASAQVCHRDPGFPPPEFTWICDLDGLPQLAEPTGTLERGNHSAVLQKPTLKRDLFDFQINGARPTLSFSEDGTLVILDSAWSCHAEDNHIVCTRPKP
jgi:hypothetical protein